MKNVEGKVAFITGGASGAGFGMAKTFSRAGMKVVIADVRQDSLDSAMAQLDHSSVHAIHLDVTDRAAFAQAANETERVFGKVHVVCNNAGINLFVPIEDVTYNDWDWIVGVNLGGVINGITTFIPYLRKHDEGGHIVNTASMAGFLPSARTVAYTATKFGVRGLTEALRCSLYKYNIGVSVFCPGLINSAIYESEKTRPARLASENIERNKQGMAHVPELNATAGMSPEEVGERVLAGIRRNQLYIFSHGEFREELQDHFDEVLESLPTDKGPEIRLQFERTRRAWLKKAREAANAIG
jgi:NAD(P)-dependent dehydrogenase (short-subunit alcohol dehydrogenase family)